MSNLTKCIVTYLDLVDISEMITLEDSRATTIMQDFHSIVHCAVNSQMPNHSHAYVWNDSALLLAEVSHSPSCEAVLREVDALKRQVDKVRSSYVISVKGHTIALPKTQCPFCFSTPDDPARFVFIKASSYAFANCFKIEHELGNLKKAYYLDSRIVDEIPDINTANRQPMALLPDNYIRDICLFDGYLWNESA